MATNLTSDCTLEGQHLTPEKDNYNRNGQGQFKLHTVEIYEHAPRGIHIAEHGIHPRAVGGIRGNPIASRGKDGTA